MVDLLNASYARGTASRVSRRRPRPPDGLFVAEPFAERADEFLPGFGER